MPLATKAELTAKLAQLNDANRLVLTVFSETHRARAVARKEYARLGQWTDEMRAAEAKMDAAITMSNVMIEAIQKCEASLAMASQGELGHGEADCGGARRERVEVACA